MRLVLAPIRASGSLERAGIHMSATRLLALRLNELEIAAMTPTEQEWMLRHLTRSHVWSHTLSRRQLLGRALGATATGALLATVGSELLNAPIGLADESDQVVEPTPIPGGDFGTHHFLPGRGKEV